MSAIRRVFSRSKTKFVLKARKEGKWEDVGEFDKQVGILEVRDLIENLLDEGYDAFRLEEVTEDGKRVRLVWTKYYKSSGRKKAQQDMNEVISNVLQQTLPTAINAGIQASMQIVNQAVSTTTQIVTTSLREVFNTVIEEFRKLREREEEKPSLAEMIAQYLYTRDLLRKIALEVAKEEGFVKGGGVEDEFDKFMKFVNFMQRLGGAYPMMMPASLMQHMQQGVQVSSPQQVSTPSPSPSPSAPSSVETVEEEDVKMIKERAQELAKRLVEETTKEVAEEIAPCKELGEC